MKSSCYTTITMSGTKQQKDKDLGREFNSEDESLTVLKLQTSASTTRRSSSAQMRTI